MRVLVVAAWPPWLDARGDGTALILSRHLRELGPRHDLHVLSAGGPDDDRTVPGGVNVQVHGRQLPAPADALWRRVRAVGTGEPAHVRYVARPTLLTELERRLQAVRPDVVQLFGWGTAGLWSHLDGVPAMHYAVDPWAGNLANRELPTWRRHLERGQLAAVRRHEQRHYPQVSAVAVVTQEDADALGRQVPEGRFAVVPNGVDAGPPPVDPPADGPVLGFHGSYGATSNQQAATALVREVLPLVQRSLPTARVVLAGHAPGPHILGLAGPDVDVLADVPDVRAVLDRIHLHVDLMTSGAGVKNKVLEALAAGRPVIGTPLALQGILGTGGTVAVPDAAAAAAAVVDLWQRQGAWQQQSAAGRKRVLAQSWAASAKALEDLWRQAASQPPATQ